MSLLSPNQIPGLSIKPPLIPPQPHEQIIGWERFRHDAACCDCEGMTQQGMIALIILAVVFWPLAFIPCLQDNCREEYQRPVYGVRGEQQVVGIYQPPVAPPKQI